MLSVSLCYAAFDFADIEVSMSSQSNRTESRLDPIFDPPILSKGSVLRWAKTGSYLWKNVGF